MVIQDPLEGLSDSEIEKHNSVVSDLSEYIQIDDTTAVGPYNRRGNAYFALGQYQNAIEDYITATSVTNAVTSSLNVSSWSVGLNVYTLVVIGDDS